jgi:hypothetical protein
MNVSLFNVNLQGMGEDATALINLKILPQYLSARTELKAPLGHSVP